ATETAQTVSGVATLAALMQQLAAAGLADQVSVMSLNVFGRTLGPASADGRQHNENHQVSITIGKPFAGGVIGGVGPVAGDFGAVAFDSRTGRPATGGDVAPLGSLVSFGRTMMAAVGADPATIGSAIPGGTVVSAAL